MYLRLNFILTRFFLIYIFFSFLFFKIKYERKPAYLSLSEGSYPLLVIAVCFYLKRKVTGVGSRRSYFGDLVIFSFSKMCSGVISVLHVPSVLLATWLDSQRQKCGPIVALRVMTRTPAHSAPPKKKNGGARNRVKNELFSVKSFQNKRS